MRKIQFVLSVFCGVVLIQPVLAKTIVVTPDDDYTVIESAGPGDEVIIASGIYQYRVSLETSGSETEPIIIRGQDPDDPPVWNLAGQVISEWPGSYGAGDAGRGCWQVRGDHYIISDIVFEECRDHGGSGLRAVNVQDLRISNCVFRNSTNGVTGAADPFVIEFSEFVGNGRPYTSNDNPAHNLYVYGGALELRYNLFHEAEQGQNFHVRARDSVIEYNWFSNPGSYMGDLMTCEHFCGGQGDQDITQSMLLRGNVIIQGNPSNTSQIIALFNDEGGSSDNTGDVATMRLTLAYNTIIGTEVSQGHTQRLVNLRNDTVGTHVILDNNAIVNVKDVAEPNNAQLLNWSISGTHNWLSTPTEAGELSASIMGADPIFENALDFDLRPRDNSPLVGAAGPSEVDVPDREYFQNESNPRMYRIRSSAGDVGAFEYATTGSGIGPYGTSPTDTDDTSPPNPDAGSTDTDGTSEDSGGCGCRVGNTDRSSSWILFLLDSGKGIFRIGNPLPPRK